MLCKLNQFWRKIVSYWKKLLMFLPLCLCVSLVLILPTLVSLLMRHTSQTIVRLDEEGFLWLSFCSFGSRSNSFDLCWTLHALIVISSYILYILHLFVCIVFGYWSYFYAFVFVWVKIQKHIKSEKFKSLIIYVWAHFTYEFGWVQSSGSPDIWNCKLPQIFFFKIGLYCQD